MPRSLSRWETGLRSLNDRKRGKGMVKSVSRRLQTGIDDRRTGEVTIVTEVPPGPVQIAAQRLSVRQARARTKNQQRKEAKRRAEGAIPRSEWLAAHRSPPWAGSGMSKSAFYRARKAGKGVAGA